MYSTEFIEQQQPTEKLIRPWKRYMTKIDIEFDYLKINRNISEMVVYKNEKSSKLAQTSKMSEFSLTFRNKTYLSH